MVSRISCRLSEVRWSHQFKRHMASPDNFMNRLGSDAEGRKVFLMFNIHRVHHAIAVQIDWLRARSRLRPSTCICTRQTPIPTNNLNQDLKTRLRSQEPRSTLHELENSKRDFIEFLEKTPKRARFYFTPGVFAMHSPD